MEITKSEIQVYESIRCTVSTARSNIIKTVNETMVLNREADY